LHNVIRFVIYCKGIIRVNKGPSLEHEKPLLLLSSNLYSLHHLGLNDVNQATIRLHLPAKIQNIGTC
jgi:hypothetical protein